MFRHTTHVECCSNILFIWRLEFEVSNGIIIGEMKVSDELSKAHLYLDTYIVLKEDEKKAIEDLGITVQ
jgi:hypothetical protein